MGTLVLLQQKINLRHEYKFLITSRIYRELQGVLGNLMQIDANTAKSEGYHIRSLYFDDIYNTAMTEKLLGFLNRNKFRVRVYDYSDRVIKLEIKEKYNDFISKKACTISREEYDEILKGNISFLHGSAHNVKERYYLEIRNNFLQPKVIVDYLREAYVLPYNQVRITFDKYLSAASPCINIFDKNMYTRQIGSDYAIIMEVKFNNFLPGHLKAVLGRYSLTRLAVSKYVLCREFIER